MQSWMFKKALTNCTHRCLVQDFILLLIKYICMNLIGHAYFSSSLNNYLPSVLTEPNSQTQEGFKSNWDEISHISIFTSWWLFKAYGALSKYSWYTRVWPLPVPRWMWETAHVLPAISYFCISTYCCNKCIYIYKKLYIYCISSRALFCSTVIQNSAVENIFG